MKQFSIHNLQFTILITFVILVVVIFLQPKTYLQPVYAQTCDPNIAYNTTYYTKGLASTPNLENNLKQTIDSKCIVDPKAAFAPYKIPSYEDLKSLYYTQSKLPDTGPNQQKYSASGDKTGTYFTSTNLARDSIHYINGNLTFNTDLASSLPKKTIIIFIEGNLDFNIISEPKHFTYGNENSGMVFVVEGDVNINKEVRGIDGIIISQGVICTAHTGSSCLSETDTTTLTPQLTINGSLISVNPNSSSPIKFRRRLADNSQPAEKIIHQPKYLVILRNLMSDTLQKWSEIQ